MTWRVKHLHVSSDKQIGGDHYTGKSVQPWDAMASWMPDDAFIGFMEGNAIKYLARWRDKGGLTDLQKAQHYLEKLIDAVATKEANQSTEKAGDDAA